MTDRMYFGASIQYWIGFHALIAVLLFVDIFLLERRKQSAALRTAWTWTIFLASLASGFALLLSKTQGRQPGLEFFSSYLVEGSLSVDNLFVFLLMFRALKLNVKEQRRVLLWGVLGAIVLRGLFIAIGISLLKRFAWVEDIFGVLLLVAAVRLLRQKPGEATSSGPARWIQKRRLKTGHARLAFPAFLLIVLAVEATDLVFALDSVPAVLAISRDPFVAYTSNIFAILGLRSLYFVMAGFLDRLRLLHYGLAVILAFVAIKMLAARWIEIPVGISLAFILGTLAIFAIASKFSRAPEPTS